MTSNQDPEWSDNSGVEARMERMFSNINDSISPSILQFPPLSAKERKRLSILDKSASDSEDTERLLVHAQSLVNDEFSYQTSNLVYSKPNHSVQNKGKTAHPTKKFESVKDARTRIRREWDVLKNSTLMNDDSMHEKVTETRRKESENEILYGVVAYVEISGNQKRLVGIKSLLRRLGATVKDAFTQEVTHVVFKNGNLNTYKRAKLLNVHLVSVLWIEACKNAQKKVCERLFPVFDTNDYTNSPRVFRKFMEFQAKNLMYDESTGQIVRRPERDNPQCIIKNLQRLNIENAPQEKADKPKKNNEKENENQIRLHFSSDSSGTSKNSSCGDETIAIINKILTQDVPKKKPERTVVEKSSSESDEPEKSKENVSPIKRKLFVKQRDDELIRVSQDTDKSTKSKGKLIAANPYSLPNVGKKRQLGKNPEKSKGESPEKRRNDAAVAERKNGEGEVGKPDRPNNYLVKWTQSSNQKKPLGKIIGRHSVKNPSLVSTSLHAFENQSLKSAVANLGGFRFRSAVDRSTTHVVVGECRRTVNLLKGVARGCWLLSKRWVEESQTAGRWLAEEHYEVVSFSKMVQRCRIQKQTFGRDFSLDIFDECGHIFVSPDSAPACHHLRELVQLCTGKLAVDPDSADIVVGQRVPGKKSVTESWILDSIVIGRCRNLLKYEMQ